MHASFDTKKTREFGKKQKFVSALATITHVATVASGLSSGRWFIILMGITTTTYLKIGRGFITAVIQYFTRKISQDRPGHKKPE